MMVSCRYPALKIFARIETECVERPHQLEGCPRFRDSLRHKEKRRRPKAENLADISIQVDLGVIDLAYRAFLGDMRPSKEL